MMKAVILIFVFMVLRLPCLASSSPQLMCPVSTSLSKLLLPFSNGDLKEQCPVTFEPNPPRESTRYHQYSQMLERNLLHGQVTGEFLEKALISQRGGQYISVLFHASWCPFSRSTRSIFEILSSMYPQIEHLAVEESSTLPSLFSRFGIHSLPAILLVNQTSWIRFHDSKDLPSLVKFYKQVTGVEAVETRAVEESGSLETGGKAIQQSWMGASSSMDEMWKREPYLLLCTLFLLLRVVMNVVPRLVYKLRAMWATYRPRMNLEIIGETSQILGRMVHVIDVKRVWTKLNLRKIRNLDRGARNARVWASSLASVSLGETSTSRLASSSSSSSSS